MDDKILEVADASTPETAAADRVKISAYQWRAAKLAPKKYGDQTVHTHTGRDGGAIEVEVREITDEELDARLRRAIAAPLSAEPIDAEFE